MSDALPHFEQLHDPQQVATVADPDMAFALVASRFNEEIVNRLVEGAAATLVARGADINQIELVQVPGAFELPGATRLCVATGMYDAVLALGCVIRGETPHFDYVAGECARGLAVLAREEDTPVVFGVLTTDTREQAERRSALFADWTAPEPRVVDGKKFGNKGAEAAMAALEMIGVCTDLAEAIDDGDGDDA